MKTILMLLTIQLQKIIVITLHIIINAIHILNEPTIEKIVEQCNLVNMGEMNLDDEIAPGSGITIADMLEDLRIDYNA